MAIFQLPLGEGKGCDGPLLKTGHTFKLTTFRNTLQIFDARFYIVKYVWCIVEIKFSSV